MHCRELFRVKGIIFYTSQTRQAHWVAIFKLQLQFLKLKLTSVSIVFLTTVILREKH